MAALALNENRVSDAQDLLNIVSADTPVTYSLTMRNILHEAPKYIQSAVVFEYLTSIYLFLDEFCG